MVGIVSCCVSTAAAIFLLVILLLPRTARHLSIGEGRILLLFLTVSNFVTTLGYPLGILDQRGYLPLLPYPSAHCNSSVLCVTQAFVNLWSANSGHLWTCAIQIFWFISIWRRRGLLPLSNIVRAVAMGVCWGIPLLIAVNALIANSLGVDEARSVAGWCWIATCREVHVDGQVMWLLLAGNSIEIVSCMSIAFFIILSIFFLHREERTRIREGTFADTEISYSTHDRLVRFRGRRDSLLGEGPTYEGDWKLLYWIPMAFIVTHLWGSCRVGFTINQLVSGNITEVTDMISYVLLYFQAIGSSSQAAINLLLLLIFQKPVRKALCCRTTTIAHHRMEM